MKGGDVLTGNEPCRLDLVFVEELEKARYADFPGVHPLNGVGMRIFLTGGDGAHPRYVERRVFAAVRTQPGGDVSLCTP